MLILNRPIQLQSISGIRMYSDKLGEKIAANYQLIGMEITSADLLHMMMQEPEQFINTEYYRTLMVENHTHIYNQLKLELINQLVNRLLLCFSPDFTYQDEVFVVSVLQKIGISDVKEFMQQIHRHMDHNMLLTKLYNSYSSQKKKIAEMVHSFYTDLQRCYQGSSETNLQQIWDNKYKFAYYLHNPIFHRLMTAKCNDTVYSYYCQLEKGKATIQGVREATWAEQTDVIGLLQFRETLFWQTNPAVWQEDIYYERKHFAQEALTEEKVIQRIAAAILENMIQKLHGIWQQREKNIVDRIPWRDYTQTFCQSAADVLERFWYYQRRQTMEIQKFETDFNRIYILIQNEWKLTQLLEDISLLYNHVDREEAEREIVLSILENQNLQKQLMGKIQLEERLAAQNFWGNANLEEEQEYRDELNTFWEIKNQWVQLKQQMQNENSILTKHKRLSSESISPTIQKDSTQNQLVAHNTFQSNNFNIVEHSASLEPKNSERTFQRQELHNNVDEQQFYSVLDDAYLKKIQGQEMGGQQPYPVLEHLQNQQESHYNYMDEFLQRYEEFVSGQQIPFSENKKLLDKINQHNLHMKHLLDSENITAENKDIVRRVVVDQKKARQTALHALENPQEALREIYAHATAIEEVLPLEIEKILRVTDENTQLFYRKLLEKQNISLPNGQNDLQDNNPSNTDSMKTKMQSLAEKETAAETIGSGLSLEKTFNSDHLKTNNTKESFSLDQIEVMLKFLLEKQNLTDNKMIPENNALLENVRSLENKEPLENKFLIENKESLKNKFLIENKESIKNKFLIENRESFEDQKWKALDFAHKPELKLTEYLENLENRVFESSDYIQQRKEFYTDLQIQLEQLKQQQTEQRELTQQQLQGIQQKLLRESEEQFTQMINHNLKTQVHAISDIVYHELERRLKNEQRRRGY